MQRQKPSSQSESAPFLGGTPHFNSVAAQPPTDPAGADGVPLPPPAGAAQRKTRTMALLAVVLVMILALCYIANQEYGVVRRTQGKAGLSTSDHHIDPGKNF